MSEVETAWNILIFAPNFIPTSKTVSFLFGFLQSRTFLRENEKSLGLFMECVCSFVVKCVKIKNQSLGFLFSNFLNKLDHKEPFIKITISNINARIF